MVRRLPSQVMLFAALFVMCAGSAGTIADRRDVQWRMIGQDPENSRNQPNEHRIRPENARRLALKWVATTAGDISATPAVVDGAVYAGDFGGMLWKLDAVTGQVMWSRRVSDYTGLAGDVARTSPSVAGNTLIVGDLRHPYMLGIDTQSGDLRWITQVHPDPKGIMTGSPVLAGNIVITGVSASGAAGPGATFRGAIVALAAQTGRILWRSYSLPDNGGVPGGYAGATMFSPPAVDRRAGLVYGTFGQPYTEPADVTACHAAHGGFDESCERPGSFLKSVVAFDLATGAPRWSYRVQGHEPWLRACGALPPEVTWCAAELDGEKWDIGGSGVNVMRVKFPRHRRDLVGGGDDSGDDRQRQDDGDDDDDDLRDVVGIGGKSGVYTVLDANTGRFIWNTLVGPGGDQGGTEWGTAFDGRRIYVPITNHHHIPYRLTQNGELTNETVTGGSWAALDPATGKILWQRADPQIETLPGLGAVGVWDLAPVTVANGVLYAASMAKLASQNQMFALDAATGEILWQFGAGSSVNSGPAVVSGSVYWGSGYSRSGIEGSGNTRLFAFSIDGR
ncbi:MAG TPA: PQQ-binding-like beta-propeller repeat protein [Vicinamibacterales bacterium]|nr:PQQ-binding-like beta-propeller repeat protein [Vicinamibacterales bacterium]